MSSDSEKLNKLSQREIEVILRGMRAIFSIAGRTILAKILAGSKAKNVKEEWRENVSYGAFAAKSQKEILAMVDWCLEEDYLKVKVLNGYPLLVYGERGLAIDVELAAREFLEEMRERGFFWTKEELLNGLPHRTLQRVMELMKEEGIEDWREVLEVWRDRGTKRMKGWIAELK